MNWSVKPYESEPSMSKKASSPLSNIILVWVNRPLEPKSESSILFQTLNQLPNCCFINQTKLNILVWFNRISFWPEPIDNPLSPLFLFHFHLLSPPLLSLSFFLPYSKHVPPKSYSLSSSFRYIYIYITKKKPPMHNFYYCFTFSFFSFFS